MKIAATLPVAAAIVAGAICFSRDASALGPVGIEVGAKVGAGTNPTGDPVTPFGFGIGARAGIIVFHIYAGAQFMYYFGGAKEEGGLHVTGKSLLYGFEGGYDIDILSLFKIRPQLGIGVFDGNYKVGGATPGDSTANGKNLYLEPGVTVVVPIGLMFVGADANAIFLPGQSGATAGFTAHGQIGIRF